MRQTLLTILTTSLVLVACRDSSKSDQSPTTSALAPPGQSATITGAAPPAPAQTAVEPTAAKTHAPALRYTGFQTPESVLYDEANDRYLVSNINGKSTEVDNNGYISVLSPDGKVTMDKWIAGGQNKVTLNAPKGSAIVAGVFYVADLDTVRMFDAKSGAPKGDVKIAGAAFLNDIAAGTDGKIYVTDSGIKASAKGDFEPTSSDAVYVIDKGKASPLAKDASLGRPNGITVGPTGVWVVTLATGELYRLDEKGKKQDAVKLPKGSLDGVVMSDGMFYISSWDASAVYKGNPTMPFEVAISNVKSPADIGLDTKRKRLLIPLFTENVVEVYEMK